MPRFQSRSAISFRPTSCGRSSSTWSRNTPCSLFPESQRWTFLHGLSWSNETSPNLVTSSPASTHRYCRHSRIFRPRRRLDRPVRRLHDRVHRRDALASSNSSRRAYLKRADCRASRRSRRNQRKARAAGIGVILDAKRGNRRDGGRLCPCLPAHPRLRRWQRRLRSRLPDRQSLDGAGHAGTLRRMRESLRQRPFRALPNVQSRRRAAPQDK